MGLAGLCAGWLAGWATLSKGGTGCRDVGAGAAERDSLGAAVGSVQGRAAAEAVREGADGGVRLPQKSRAAYI